MKINKGDVVLLKWNALDSQIGKDIIKDKHMFVVLSTNSNNIIASNTSSKVAKVSKKYPFNIPIHSCSTLRLDKPTHVKVDNIVNININDVYDKVGHLCNSDYIKVLTAYHNCPSSKYIVIEVLK